jgi:hypothetical protein
MLLNGFATETEAVIYPAIGAILLSGYLGYKSIVTDNPPPKQSAVIVAVLLDHLNGSIWSMYTPRGTKWRGLDEFRGAPIAPSRTRETHRQIRPARGTIPRSDARG